MKKLLALLLAVISLLALSACTTGNASSPSTDNSTITESVSASPSDETADVQPSEPVSDSVSNTSEYIGEDKAKAIALEEAGLSESDVTFIKVKLDYDDGRQAYDVEFYSNNTEYDYEIDAYTGEILSYDYDIESYSMDATLSNNGNLISLDEAKAIALEKAGLTESDVTFTKESQDYDDGIATYDIEFISGDMEHEFEIDATSGDIIEYNVESKYD